MISSLSSLIKRPTLDRRIAAAQSRGWVFPSGTDAAADRLVKSGQYAERGDVTVFGGSLEQLVASVERREQADAALKPEARVFSEDV